MPQDEALAFAAKSGIGHLTTYVDGRIESVLIPFFVDDLMNPASRRWRCLAAPGCRERTA
jgi:hypothetical protein